jgi:hypothetical protein
MHTTLLAGLLLGLAPTAVRADDDRDVIQTAMLSFFVRQEWHSADWKPKQHVILRPSFRPASRADFSLSVKEGIREAQRNVAHLESAIGTPKTDPATTKRWKRALQVAEAELSGLAAIQKNMLGAPAYKASPIVQPGSLTWDKRILVTDKSNRPRFGPDNNRDASLETWTVYATAAPPTYSPNGRYALIQLHIPWSMHSSDITFYMERVGEKWVQKVVQSKFYV